MINYTKLNNLIGWFTFLIAITVYILTLEPTSSFWDCGEYISSAYKLQVCHQPGAPMFLMISKVLSLFASDVSQVAWWVNFGSALSGGATIMFLFWTITHLAKKLVLYTNSNETKGELSLTQLILIMGSGFVGAMSYTFSDTFWFLTEEAEVYSMATLCIAIVFWAILKWENEADDIKADRWILFIAYMIGLSIGVRILDLLAIPALGMVYYFKRYTPTIKGTIYVFLISCGILGFIQYGIIPGTISLVAKFDLFFVNSLGLGFGSGVIVFIILFVSALVYAINYTIKKQMYLMNLVVLCVTFIMIGYGSYAMIVIRAIADPPLNNNDPSNAYSLLGYLNREQYGDNPLLIGPMYTSPMTDQKQGAMMYRKGGKRYEEVGYRPIAVYDKNILFPRMYSDQAHHVRFYKQWENIKGQPTFVDNIHFFLSYQVNHMYFRYFMWNFVGRQNDIQGQGSVNEGNWISGIKPLDELRLGNQSDLPESITGNKAYNRLYFLPLLLGLAGMFLQFNRNIKDFTVVFLLFFMTGLAIILYLNQTPLQPRERDYAYTGSFYAFAIWIGLGVISVYDLFSKMLNKTLAASLSTVLCVIFVPALMASEEWDDHDRSNRYVTRDLAANYLNSCATNAIIFTYGDNDTYPLWYCQEVENIRPDIRLVNLSLLGTDWYGRQMKGKMNESAPLNISLENSQFATGIRDYTPFYDQKIEGNIELEDVIGFIANDSPEAKAQTQGGNWINFLPTKNLRLTIDKEEMVKNGLFTQQEIEQALDIIWSIKNNSLYKNDLLALDIIANHINDRPIYFAITVPDANFYGLQDYFRNEGFAYRLVPFKVKEDDNLFGREGGVNTDILYHNMIDVFSWGNYNSGNIYVDPESSRMTTTCNANFTVLAQALYNEGKIDSCIKVLDVMQANIPFTSNNIGYSLIPDYIASELYYKCNQPQKAEVILNRLANFINSQCNYYISMGIYGVSRFNDEVSFGLSLLMQMQQTAEEFEDDKMAKQLSDNVIKLHNRVLPFTGDGR